MCMSCCDDDIGEDCVLILLCTAVDIVLTKRMYLQGELLELFVTLALCHSVRVEKTNISDPASDYEYQSSSPDEKALVEACRRLVHLCAFMDCGLSRKLPTTLLLALCTRFYLTVHQVHFDF